jgi:ketosteroid isomerase-like protein
MRRKAGASLALVLVAIGLVAAGCGNPAVTPSSSSSSREIRKAYSSSAVAVVASFYSALSNKETDRAMTYVADDASFINASGSYDGREEIRGLLQANANQDTTFELDNFRATGGHVAYDFVIRQGDLAVAQGTNGVTIVERGKIVFDGDETNEPR